MSSRMMMGGGEIIQISLGSQANAITSHLLNLEGLACTTSSPSSYDGDSGEGNSIPLCDPNVTHGVSEGGKYYVPRVLFVDGKDGFVRGTRESSSSSTSGGGDGGGGGSGGRRQRPTIAGGIGGGSSDSRQQYQNVVAAWDGQVEIHHNANDAGHFTQPEAADPLVRFHEAASVLATSTYSRYNTRSNPYSTRHIYNTNTSHSSNERHMTWDSHDEGEEQSEEDEEHQIQRQRAQKLAWLRQSQQLQNELDQAWDEVMLRVNPINNEVIDTYTLTNVSTATAFSLGWYDYWMPPHPPFHSYAVMLPFRTAVTSSSLALNSFRTGHYPSSSSSSSGNDDTITTAWQNDVLFEKLRKIMETCDTIKGIQIITENTRSSGSLHAGIACSILEECGDECSGAGRFATVVMEENDVDDDGYNKKRENGENRIDTGEQSERDSIQKFRRGINDGLTLHGLASNSDVTLPISFSRCHGIAAPTATTAVTTAAAAAGRSNTNTSSFRGGAMVAMALEASTLPHRLLMEGVGSTASVDSSGQGSRKRRSKIGIQSGYFRGSSYQDDSYATAERLSFHEYLACLKPGSHRHCVLELDVCVQPLNDRLELYKRLLQGTSIERKKREEERGRSRGGGAGAGGGSGAGYSNRFYHGRRGEDDVFVDPGKWLDQQNDNDNFNMLTALSPTDSTHGRGMHRHFALSSTVRPHSTDIITDPVTAYTTPLMEGMGVRYRPEVSLGTVVRQSITNLTSGGYGVGSYWKSIVPDIADVPVVSVLGNTTRIYPYLHMVSGSMKTSLTSWKYKGYQSRDVMNGLIPEIDDCTDALEFCLDVRDEYEPPGGSGIGVDEEGVYFDGNIE